jgi:lipopolysaccharide/colanic/teichoic acid biosynthesis glycosyltransferase
MKEIFTNTLELDKFLAYDLLLKNENILKRPVKETTNRKAWKLPLIGYKFKIKDPAEFSSLERIRVVVDSLLADISIEELCQKERISKETFLKWKHEFLEAFNKHSEDILIQENLDSSTKELILKEANVEVYNFFKSYIDVFSAKNLVIRRGEKLSTYSSFNRIENVIVLDKINNFRQINKHLEEVNCKLVNGGLLMGCFETFTARAQKKTIYNIPILKELYFGFEFIFKRVFPKLPYLKKIYFYVTKGKDRLLSKAEALGRLVSCGFDIIEYKVIDGIHYFTAMKVKEPAYDMSPSYGPLFKMRRVGKNGKIIGVYKLRTMHPYSEYLQDYVLKLNGYSETGKLANDFRLVPYGKFLRRFWIDEIPQVINLIKGDLKIVGVRPVSQSYFDNIPKEIQELRLTQKPGCIPPYVALNRPSSVESVLQSEKEYLKEKIVNPYTTDIKYFVRAIYNILFKGKRSA